MGEQEKLLLETKKEIRSILLSTKSGVELTRLNKEYEMFTGAKINFRGMGYSSLRAFVDDIPDVARQFEDGFGTITLLGVADESTRHIASLVSRQRGKKKSIRGRHYPGPRLGLMSNLPTRSSYSSRSFVDSHSYHSPRYGRAIYRTNSSSSPVAGKLRSSVSDQRSPVFARPADRQPSKDIGRETVAPALMTMDPGMTAAVRGVKTMDPGKKAANPGLQIVVTGLKRRVVESRTFVPNLKQMLTLLMDRLSGSVMYSSFKKSFEREFGMKLDLAEFGYSSVSEMFSSLGIPARVKPFCSDDYTILPGPIAAACDTDKGEKRPWNLDARSIPAFSVERPAAFAARPIVHQDPESPQLPVPFPVPQCSVHDLDGAPPIQCPPSMTSRPSSRRMSLVSRCSRTAVTSVSDKPKLPSTPSVSQQLRDAISQVLKNSPNGILMGDLEAKLKEMTGVEINIESTGARSLEHLLVNVPEIVLMEYRGHGQLLLFDPGQTAVKDKTDQGRTFERKDTPATDVDCSGRGPEHRGLDQLRESRSKPRDLLEDSVRGPDQVIASLQLMVGANDYLPVYVSNVMSPGHFWFQIDGEQYHRLVELMEMLQSTYNAPTGCQYAMPQSLMKIGQLCAAKFPEDHNWHRGTITGFKDPSVQIYYLDYGTTSFVSKDELRILRPPYLTLPAQAIRARLANVQPVNGEWSRAAYTFFMEHFTNKRLTALITNITRDGLVSVCLTDTNGDDDIHLNDCLVKEGFAVMQEDDYESEVQASKKVDASTSITDLKPVKAEPSRTGNEDEANLITEQDIKFVRLTPNYACHMVRLSDKLYIISNEISAFLWEENLLRYMVRQKGYGYLPKLVLRIDDHLAAMEELAKFKIPGVFVDGEFSKILVLYELSVVIEILEIFEHKSVELKAALKKHLDVFSAYPSKWTASAVAGVGDEDCVTVMSDDLAVRSGPSQCNIEAGNSDNAKELQKEWKMIAEQRKKLLQQMPNSASPKTSVFAVEELSRMEVQMKVLEDRYDTIQKRLGMADVNNNAKVNNNRLVTASVADATAEKVQGLSVAQKRPRTNCVAPMTQAEPAPATANVHRDPVAAPVSLPSAGPPLSIGLPSGVVRPPGSGFASSIRPAMEYRQQMDNLSHMLSQMNLHNPAQLPGPMSLLGLASLPYQLPNSQLHTPFGYSAAQQILMQQQSYFAALQGLSSLVSGGSSYPQTPYDSSLLGITNLSYLAHAAPQGPALPRTHQQQEPRQN